MPPPTPLTILTGFLGSGKTTILLNLLPQLPQNYKLALLKNEFGDQAIDTQLASSSSISGVRELLNGCICCNLVGQLGDALNELRGQGVDRIIIETSGSAFPATLVMEVNRLIREDMDFSEQKDSGEVKYTLDAVLSVIDVENWEGYEDTSPTARMQARYTDMVIFNKWELVDERRFDECLDRLGDLEVQTPWVKSDKGRVGRDVLLGVDGALSRAFGETGLNDSGGELVHADGHDHKHAHGSGDGHMSEVEVLSLTLPRTSAGDGTVDLESFLKFLETTPKDEVYRIKGVVYAASPLPSSDESATVSSSNGRYILNWAFGRWTSLPVPAMLAADEPILKLTMVCARYESDKWKERLEAGSLVKTTHLKDGKSQLVVDRIS